MQMTSWPLLTLFHTALSLVAIISGLLVAKGLIASAGRQLWTVLFLYTAAATTVTGFFFPFKGFTPAFILGVVSLLPLALAFFARYRHRLIGGWRGTYVISAMLILYFNCFVLIVQSFQKLPSLHAFAPTQSEPPFQLAQLATLIGFVVMSVIAFKNYRPKSLTDELPTTYVSPHLEIE